MKNRLVLFGTSLLIGISIGLLVKKEKKKIPMDLIKDLKKSREINNVWCFMNDCAAIDYMKGSNDKMDQIIIKYS